MANGTVSPPATPKPTFAVSWQLLLGAVSAIVVMWLGGIVSNFWMALGVIGFLGILALFQALPFRRVATAVFIGWVAVSFGLPILAVALRADWPVLAEAWRRHSSMRQLETAEWLDPVAYRARIGIARYCQQVDKIQGEWLANRLEELKEGLKQGAQPKFLGSKGTPAFPLPSLEEQGVYSLLTLIEQHRQECRAVFSRQPTQVQAGAPALQPLAWLTSWLLVAVVALLLFLVVVLLWRGKQAQPANAMPAPAVVTGATMTPAVSTRHLVASGLAFIVAWALFKWLIGVPFGQEYFKGISDLLQGKMVPTAIPGALAVDAGLIGFVFAVWGQWTAARWGRPLAQLVFVWTILLGLAVVIVPDWMLAKITTTLVTTPALFAGAFLVIVAVPLLAIFVPKVVKGMLIAAAVIVGVGFLAWIVFATGSVGILKGVVDGSASPKTMFVVMGLLWLVALSVSIAFRSQSSKQGGQKQ